LVERVTDDPSLNRPEALLSLSAALEPEARAAVARRPKGAPGPKKSPGG
jgi:hypothetical protein